MVKKRSFWIGIGLGLVVGSILLQLMTIGAKNTASSSHVLEEANVETISRHAESHGYQLVASNTIWLAEEEHEDKLAQAVSDALESIEREEIMKFEKSMYITPGMTSSQVADQLMALSVIVDKDEFINEIRARNLTGSIQPGLIKFVEEVSLDEVIEQITRK